MPINVLSSLQMTAEAMGRRMGIQLRVGGDTAYTDGKNINLPTLPETEEALILARGYIDHEAAHIALTDFNVPVTIWNNIIEDVRIEVEQSKLYPGIRKNITALIDLLVRKGEYLDWDENPKSLLAAWVSMRARVNAGYDNLRKRVKKAEKAALSAFGTEFCGKIEDIISRIPQCKNTQDSYNLGQEIEKLIQDSQKKKEDSQKKKSNKSGKSDKSKENSDSPGSGSGSGSDSGSDLGSDSGSGSSGSGSDSSGSKSGSGSGSGSRFTELANSDDPDNADLGKIIAKAIDKKHEQQNVNDLSSMVCPSTEGTPSLSEVRNIPPVAGMVSQIKGLLQAQQMRYHAEKTSGHKLSRYAACKIACQTPDSRLFLKRELRKDLNTAVAILLDHSGSMGGTHGNDIDTACAASYMAAYCMDMNNIPCMVGAFPSFSIIKDFSNRTTKKMMIEATGTTPIAETLIWASGLLLPRREQRKIVVVVTDGEPNDSATAREAVDRMVKNYGFEVYAIGIGPAAEQCLPWWFKDNDKKRTIYSIQEFPKALMEVLRYGLTKNQVK